MASFILMHKEIEVARLDSNSETGYITKIDEIICPEHLPIGVKDRATLNEWWTNRSIPASRTGIGDALEVLGFSDTQMLLLKCFGLSLSDQYWVKPANSNIKWNDINFFNNEFSDDIGNILFGDKACDQEISLISPDNTSDGNLKKRWKIINGKRYLIKAGSAPFRQQPFNEVIASVVCKRLNIPHIDYDVVWIDGAPYSVCEDFVNSDTELVGAWRIYQTQKKDNHTSIYQHYINCCKALGIDGIENFIDKMLVLDYIIANEDRHLNNFGMLRNAETLEWISPAPIFDSGTSLGYDKLPNQIISDKQLSSKPFKRYHHEQIKLVKSFDWLDFAQLDGIENDIDDILSGQNVQEYIDETRKKAIISSVLKRIGELKKLSNNKEFRDDDINDDLSFDVAAKYDK